MSRAVWIRRLAFAVTVAVALGYVPYHLYASSGLHRYLKLRAERDGLHRANLDLYEENQRLRAELEALAGGDAEGETLSPAAVERAARDELGLVKPGEIVFKVEAAAR
jgi:cell division protein FtsB